MKKLFTLLTAISIGSLAFGQVIFQSNFENWTSVAPIVPTDFNGTRTTLDTDSIMKVTTGAVYGSNTVELQHSIGTSGFRFSTQPVSVTTGTTYTVTYWVKGEGDIDVRLWDGSYQGSVIYNTIDTASNQMITRQVSAGNTSAAAEFIFYVRQTNPLNNLQIDSIAISVGTPPVANIKKIYDIQFTTNPNGDSPEMGNVVTTRGVVTGIVRNGPDRHSFFIQDSAKAWNGIYIYETNDSSLVIGDSVEVTGTVDEFNLGTGPDDLTEIKSVTNITVLNSGNPLPAASAVSTLNANMEEWEGVLINVTNAQCMSTSIGFGQWSLDDGSGVILADDDIFFYHTTAVVGTNYDVTGIGTFTFDEFKILPRDFNDISISTGIVETTSADYLVYPNPANEVLNFNLDVSNATITIFDITGKTVNTINTKANKTSVSINALSNGLYFYNITDGEGNTIATDRFVVAK
jgi:hypothetical protein